MGRAEGIQNFLTHWLAKSNDQLGFTVNREGWFGRKITIHKSLEHEGISDLIDGIKLINKKELNPDQLKNLKKFIKKLNFEVNEYSNIFSSIFLGSRLSSLNALYKEVKNLQPKKEEPKVHEKIVQRRNNFDTCGLPLNATQAELKKAFYDLARERHPDKPTGSPEKFKALNYAYDRILKANRWTR